MGRSQVKRNQRNGRPGGRGRGQSEIDPKNKSQPKNTATVVGLGRLGDNSFRYQDQEDNQQEQEEVEDDWDNVASNNAYYGPSHDFVQIASLKTPMISEEYTSASEGGLRGHATIDMSKLASCLESMERSEWMRLSNRLIDVYDERLGKNSGEKKKMTIAEMKAFPVVRVEDVANVVQDLTIEDSEKQNPVEGDDDDDSEQEEDLDAWLDGVID